MLRLPTEIQTAAIYRLKPYDLLHVAGVCKQLRGIALGLLWVRVDYNNRCARRMLKGMLRDTPPEDEALRGVLRTQMLPLIRHFSAPCAFVWDLLRGGELASLQSFDLTWTKLPTGYESGPAVELPNLTHLGIPVVDHTPDHYVLQMFRDIVSTAPKLTSVSLRGRISRYALDEVALLPRLERLRLLDDGLLPTALQDLWNHIEPHHLRKLTIFGMQEFIKAMFQTIKNTAITALDLKVNHSFIATTGKVQIGDPSALIPNIMRYPSLTDLHLAIHADNKWTAPRILALLRAIPNLTSFKFFVSGQWQPGDAVNMTSTEAEYILRTWPSLRVVAVALADHGFFLTILNLRHLQELELNAWRWAEGSVDACEEPHTALCSLRFSGCPSRWVENGPTDLNLARFPNLQGPVIIRGDGGTVVENIPNWAKSNDSSGMDEDEEDYDDDDYDDE